MKIQTYPIHYDHPAIYRIQLLGKLGPEWSTTFDNLDLEVDETQNGRVITTLRGPIPDQAALHGLLNQIRDLGMVLLLVGQIGNRLEYQDLS